MSDNEMIDWVSEDDTQVLATLQRRLLYENDRPQGRFRVINAFIVNDKGQFWIPTRSGLKKLFPLALETSIGGHVLSGESYEAAFIREAIEETGLDPRQTGYRFIGKLTPGEHGVSAFMHVYLIKYNGDVPYNPQDFVSHKWIEPSKLLEQLKAGVYAKSDLIKILQAINETIPSISSSIRN